MTTSTPKEPITISPSGALSNERVGSPLFAKIYEEPGAHIMIQSQVPGFVRDDHPKFVQFLEAYYEWMETAGNVAYHKRKLKKYQDVDDTTDEMFEHFWKEFVTNLPKYVLADRKTLLKNIRHFYRAKGTEKAYRLFFRILYNTSVEFYYPRTDILRASDGKWIKNISIKAIPIKGTLQNVRNQKIVARDTGISAFVDRGVIVPFQQSEAYELTLNTSSITGTLRGNDIIETLDGSFVARVSPIPNKVSWYSNVLTPKEQHRGKGYKQGDVFKIPDNPAFGGSGAGAVVKVDSVYSDGSINGLVMIKFGLEYYYSEKAASYAVDLNASTVIGETAGSGAKIVVQIGGTTNYPGYYMGNDGHLSSGKYIHDGTFYQQFSYVTITNESSSDYENLLKEILHPAGFKFFGQFRTHSLVASKPKIPELQKNQHVRIEIKQFAYPRQGTQTALNATCKVYTNVCIKHQVVQDPISAPIGASLRSLYRERFNYKPTERFDDLLSGLWGDSQNTQTANTSISTFSELNIKPKDLQTGPVQKRINIQPDGVVKKP